MSGWQLGERVRFTHWLWRGWSGVDGPAGYGKAWRRAGVQDRAGVVVGVRRLADGAVRFSEEGAASFKPSEHFEAVLVAFDIRQKPVYVLPEDLTRITEGGPSA